MLISRSLETDLGIPFVEYRLSYLNIADDKWHDDDVACLLEIHIDEAEIEAEAEKILAAATQPFVLFRKS